MLKKLNVFSYNWDQGKNVLLPLIQYSAGSYIWCKKARKEIKGINIGKVGIKFPPFQVA